MQSFNDFKLIWIMVIWWKVKKKLPCQRFCLSECEIGCFLLISKMRWMNKNKYTMKKLGFAYVNVSFHLQLIKKSESHSSNRNSCFWPLVFVSCQEAICTKDLFIYFDFCLFLLEKYVCISPHNLYDETLLKKIHFHFLNTKE